MGFLYSLTALVPRRDRERKVGAVRMIPPHKFFYSLGVGQSVSLTHK